MLGSFDIQSSAGALVQSGSVFEKKDLVIEDGTVDTGLGTLVAQRDGYPGATVQGDGSLVVKGSLRGNERWPCRIEVSGDVVVVGEVVHSEIKARRIYVGTSAEQVRFYAREGIEVGQHLTASQIGLGDYELERRTMGKMRERIAKAIVEKDFLERQLRMEEKRVDKLFKTTRIQMTGIGEIVQMKSKRVVINLNPLYKILKGKSEADVDKALLVFFSKAVLGVITRVNKPFLTGNKHRHRILKSAIRDVHNLFFLARKYDKVGLRISELDEEVGRLGEALESRSCVLYVGGEIRPQMDARFTVAKVEQLEENEVLISGDSARLMVRNQGAVKLGVTKMDIEGTTKVQNIQMDELHHCEIRVEEGQVVWQPIEA